MFSICATSVEFRPCFCSLRRTTTPDRASARREVGDLYDLPTLERRLMGADPDGGPVRRLFYVRKWVAIFKESGHELVDEMWMRTTVTAALDEREMIFVGDALRELANRLGQKVSVVRNLDAFCYLRLRFLRGVEHGVLIGDELPFERLLRSVDVDALAILSCGIPKEPPDVRRKIRVLDLDVTRLDSELRAGPARALVVNRPEPKQLTYSAMPLTMAMRGLTTWVA